MTNCVHIKWTSRATGPRHERPSTKFSNQINSYNSTRRRNVRSLTKVLAEVNTSLMLKTFLEISLSNTSFLTMIISSHSVMKCLTLLTVLLQKGQGSGPACTMSFIRYSWVIQVWPDRSLLLMSSSLLFNKLSMSHFSTSGLISNIFSQLKWTLCCVLTEFVYCSLPSEGIKLNFMLRHLLNVSTAPLPAEELKLTLCCVTHWICLLLSYQQRIKMNFMLRQLLNLSITPTSPLPKIVVVFRAELCVVFISLCLVFLLGILCCCKL